MFSNKVLYKRLISYLDTLTILHLPQNPLRRLLNALLLRKVRILKKTKLVREFPKEEKLLDSSGRDRDLG